MKAKKVEVETRTPSREPVGSGRLRLTLPPPTRSTAQVLGEGPAAAPAVVDLLIDPTVPDVVRARALAHVSADLTRHPAGRARLAA